MSFQAYLDTIKAKTGKTAADFKKLAEKKGLLKEGVKAGQVFAWLKEEYDLGRGHAMALFVVFNGTREKQEPLEQRIASHFGGKKEHWQPVFNSLMKRLTTFGDDITIAPAKNYLSILRKGRKMAVVQVTAARMYIGIKLKSVRVTKRFESAAAWNEMVTHRVTITDKKQIDAELIDWLRSAYEQNGPAKARSKTT